MKLSKIRRRLMGLSIFAVMGASLFLAGANVLTTKAAEAEVAINETNFPDDTFRKYVEKFDTDKSHSFSSTELLAVKLIDVDAFGEPGNIASLKGIEYFTALEYLNCVNNQLTSLDVRSNTALKSLYCSENQLTSLDVGMNTALKFLVCGDNQLTSLDVSKNKFLTNLNCVNNQLTSLDVSKNTALYELKCYDNQLTSLDVGENTALFDLDCGGNQLTSIDVSKNTNLNYLYCDNNTHKITFSTDNTFDMSTLPGMDVSRVSDIQGGTIKENILTLDSDVDEVTYTYNCGNSKTAKFKLVGKVVINETNFPDDTFRKYVMQFDTDENGSFSSDEIQAVQEMGVNGTDEEPGDIASLKGIEYFTALKGLDCNYNQLTSLDVSNNTALIGLNCVGNIYTITLSEDNTFDMTTLPGMDVSKVSNITGGTIKGNILTGDDSDATAVIYDYDCGNGKTAQFKLVVKVSAKVAFNETNFPDSKFRESIKEFDTDGNGSFSNTEIRAIKEINVWSKDIASLKGIEYFTALKSLKCGANELTNLDVSKNTALEYLECRSNQLTNINLSRNTVLKVLICDCNSLTSLDVSKNTALKKLFCDSNKYTIIISKDNTFDMSALPGMDVSKVSNIKGGTIKGNILTVNSGAWTVTYQYDCGNGKTTEFNLEVKVPISYAKVTLPKSSYAYTGSAITPAATVTYGGKKLVAGTDYTVTYSNNKAVGKATVTITGKGNYTGTVKKTFKIVPASTTVKSLTNKAKGITIKWKKAKGAGGYIIYRSKNGGKYSRIKTISSGKTVSYTDKSATTNGAKYRYKIISYKKVGKTIYKSAYSKTKTIYRISAPKIKELSNKPERKIAIKWTKNKRATGYQIQYATNSKFKKAKTVTVKKAGAVSKVIKKLKKNSTYRVRIRAYKTVSGKKYYSAWSSKKSVKIRK